MKNLLNQLTIDLEALSLLIKELQEVLEKLEEAEQLPEKTQGKNESVKESEVISQNEKD